MTNDNINCAGSKRKGRKKKLSSSETQHSVYIDPDLWDAAGSLPISRPDIIRQAFLNAIAFYYDDLPKLRYKLEELRSQKQALESKEAVILSRIEQLEAEAVIAVNDQKKKEEIEEIVVNETLRMCSAFKKKMGHPQFSKLSELSGIDAAKIEVFLKDAKYRPSEEEVRIFYKG